MTAQIEPKDTIKTGERTALRTAIRAHIKALRSEVEQRRMELLADVEHRIAARYQADGARMSELSRRIKDLAADANQQLRELVAEYSDVVSDASYGTFSTPHTYRRETSRDRLKAAMVAEVNAQANRASGAIDRLEANLLTDLMRTALKTDAAMVFLEGMPTITDLMPARPLAEIEAKFVQEHPDDV